MTITWYGQSCFRLESKGTSILIDPFSKEIGLRPPRIYPVRSQSPGAIADTPAYRTSNGASIFLVTHEHYDHNNIEGAPAESFIIRGPGEYEKSGVYIEGIASYHDNTQGTERGLNTIYLIRMEDMKLCHLGDLGQTKLTDEQVEQIGDVDVLFIPIGGKYTIDGKEAAGGVKQIEPKIIIPMHYKVWGLDIDIDGPQKFLKEVGIKSEETETLKITAKNLPTEEIKLITFKL